MPIWHAWKYRLCTALFAGVLSSQCAMAAPTLSIVTTPGTPVAGNNMGLDVKITGAVDLAYYQYSLSFDVNAFQSLGAGTEGPFLSSGGANTFFDGGTIDNVLGTISFAFDAILGPVAGVTGNGLLAHYDFFVKTGGVVKFSFSDVLALDSAGNDLGAQAPGTTESVIPEPTSLALVGLGFGLAGFSARRRTTAA